MQDLQGLTINKFLEPNHVVIGKVMVEKDWLGNFEELPDVLDFSLSTTIKNILQRLCAVGFNITALNTNDRYALRDEGASHYDWLRQGRRIRIYAGIKVGEDNYHWKWITGRIDEPKFSESGSKEIVNISGRDYMRMLIESPIKQEWWGKQKLFDTVEGKETYSMPADCKGIYRLWVDIDAKDSSNLLELTEGSDWSYDWNTNKLLFLRSTIPPCDGLSNLLIFYFQTQKVESVIADILVYAGVLELKDRKEWLDNTDYVTPTNKTIDRVVFKKDMRCLEAIRLLLEVVTYRLHPNQDGIFILKPKPPETDPPVQMMSRWDIEEISHGESLDEVYNQILIEGEERIRIEKLLTVTTDSEVTNDGPNQFESRGVIEDIGTANATKRGFELGVEHKAKDDFWEESGSFGVGGFTHLWTDLVGGKQYFFRAWAKNIQGKFFGKWQEHVTSES